MRLLAPGSSTYLAPGMCSARYRPCSGATGLSARAITSVGTPIAGSTARTSVASIILIIASAVPGLTECRSYRPHDPLRAASSTRPGANSRIIAPWPHSSDPIASRRWAVESGAVPKG